MVKTNLTSHITTAANYKNLVYAWNIKVVNRNSRCMDERSKII